MDRRNTSTTVGMVIRAEAPRVAQVMPEKLPIVQMVKFWSWLLSAKVIMKSVPASQM